MSFCADYELAGSGALLSDMAVRLFGQSHSHHRVVAVVLLVSNDSGQLAR